MRRCSTGCWTTRAAPGWASASTTTGSEMAELFAPFSKVAAKNPFSSSPVERSVEEIDHRHRREPDDLRPVSPTAGGPRHRQPGRSRAGDVGGRRPPTRGARGEVGVPARARRSDRAGPAGPRRPQRQLLGETGCGRSTSGRRDRHRRRGDLRSLQLLPVPGLRGVRRVRARRRRPARAHPHRRTAVLRRPRQQLLAARRSPRPSPKCGTSQGHSASSAPTAAS